MQTRPAVFSSIFLASSLLLAMPAQAFDMGNMMNPSKWVGGNNDRYDDDDDYYDYGPPPGYGGYGGPGYGGYGAPGYGGGYGGPGYGGYGAPGYGGGTVARVTAVTVHPATVEAPRARDCRHMTTARQAHHCPGAAIPVRPMAATTPARQTRATMAPASPAMTRWKSSA